MGLHACTAVTATTTLRRLLLRDLVVADEGEEGPWGALELVSYDLARKANPDVVICVDGSQAVPHMPVSVRDLDVGLHRAALERVVDACQRHNKAAGYLVNNIEEGAERLRQGFRCLAYGGDLWLYRRALREGI